MRRIIINALCMVFVIALFTGHVSAASRSEVKEKLPLLDRYQLIQIGGSEILLLLYGKGLPVPEVVTGEEGHITELMFKNSINKVKPSGLLDGSPIVSKIQFEQRGKDAVVIIHSADDGLFIKEIRGAGPSDRFSIMLTARKRRLKLEDEVKLTQTRLPPVPSIPDFQKNSPVTLDVRDVSLADVIRLLAGVTDKNIVIDASLPDETVTMTLNELPLNVAVDHLKKMYDIDFAMLGDNTILAGSRSGLARMTGREVTRVFHIAYADVRQLPDILAGVMRLNDEEQKNITVDDRLRRLYITAPPERLDEMAAVLQSLDSPGKQVMLHARIFEFNDNYSKEVDSMVNAIYDNWWLNYSNGTGRIGVITDSGTRGAVPIPTWVPGAGIVDGSWRYIDAALQANEEKNIGRVLANPSVITYDGQEATIRLTQEMPYRVRQRGTSGAEEMYTTEFKEAGPVMKMKPTIGRDGVITIQVDLESSEFGTSTAEGPAVSTRQVATNVRVRDGEPFVVGGLHSENNSKINRKIPILGDIPLLGALFRFVSNESRNTQVVMLVVPYILDTPDAQMEGASLLFGRQR